MPCDEIKTMISGAIGEGGFVDVELGGPGECRLAIVTRSEQHGAEVVAERQR